jgi:hypothetical protein
VDGKDYHGNACVGEEAVCPVMHPDVLSRLWYYYAELRGYLICQSMKTQTRPLNATDLHPLGLLLLFRRRSS